VFVPVRGPLLSAVILYGCTVPSEPWPDEHAGRVEGTVMQNAGLAGDVWAFLYAPGEGPPGPPAVPQLLTAISAQRLSQGDAHYVFGEVPPNPYRLWGFLDVDSSFDPSIDVLAQPTAGDRVVGQGVELNLQPGQVLTQNFAPSVEVIDEPPSFRLDGDETDVPLDTTVGSQPVVLSLVSDPVGHFDPKRTAFHVGLLDANNDGKADDANGDGVPDLSLQIFLRWLPRPGEDSGMGNVIVPLVIDPSPFLATLNGRVGIEIAVTQLQGAVVGQASRLVTSPGMAPTLMAVGTAPRGDYELIALTPSGQFWRLPNDLRGEQTSQGVRFHFDRTGP
jgi:hypothetical protein